MCCKKLLLSLTPSSEAHTISPAPVLETSDALNCGQTHSDCSGKVDDMHANAEEFDNDAEAVFRLIQIFTSCCASFAHGANDIANAMGPFMTVYAVYHAGKVDKSNDVSTDSYVVFLLCTIHSYLEYIVCISCRPC